MLLHVLIDLLPLSTLERNYSHLGVGVTKPNGGAWSTSGKRTSSGAWGPRQEELAPLQGWRDQYHHLPYLAYPSAKPVL